ncbi:hypothetical protein QBC46DRAFT_272969 [Diplogelasinospora grovesii]|uniref:Uncharacterized protein n=1 Tax=Diplogelasinospora grovesii TaxID=303347 RepID=A0AAN6MWP5_9PEZI|nr:hypothetical protein QBC46DRAFT_272969 [Diplogelasinospora grovesii]
MATFDRSILAYVPSLEAAHALVTNNPKFDSFLSEFQTVAAQHQKDDIYRVTLVHRHTEVALDHRIMDFKQTLQTFPLHDSAQDIHGYPIRPKSLVLHEGQWKPYEYEFGASDDSSDSTFLARVQEMIKHHGLEYVGLRRYSPTDPEELEITASGGISVKVPWNSLLETKFSYQQLVWAFPSGQPKNYRCSCRDTGSSTNPNHNHINQP